MSTTDRHYRASPELLRDALEVLRPGLATVWVDTAPPPGGWPPEVAGAAEEAARLAGVQARGGRPRRPGLPPTVVALNAADDARFALALALAPHSTLAEGMSRAGRLVCSRPGRHALRLRLTDEEHDILAGSGRLVVTGPPRTGEQRVTGAFTVAICVYAVLRLTEMAATDWRAHPQGLDLILPAAEFAAALLLALAGVLELRVRLGGRPLLGRLRRPRA